MAIGISNISLDFKEEMLGLVFGFLSENMTEPVGSPDVVELDSVAEYLNFDTSIWYFTLLRRFTFPGKPKNWLVVKFKSTTETNHGNH